VEKFQVLLESANLNLLEVAVVGGSSNDPEVKVLQSLFPKANITYLGIDNYGRESNWVYLDLNINNMSNRSYDFVICCQVIEHVWNISSAFLLLHSLVNKNGYIWVNCPTSNIAHGSPEYYSAGYTDTFLKQNLEQLGFKTITCGCLGSERYYNSTHLFRHWLSSKEHQNPIYGYEFSRITNLSRLKEFLYSVPSRFITLAWNSKISNDIKYSTESFYFGKK